MKKRNTALIVGGVATALIVSAIILHSTLPGLYAGGLVSGLGYTYTDWTGTFSICYPLTWQIDMATINAAGELPEFYYYLIENNWADIVRAGKEADFPKSMYVFKAVSGEAMANVFVQLYTLAFSLEKGIDDMLSELVKIPGFYLYEKRWLTRWHDAFLLEYKLPSPDGYLLHEAQILTRRNKLNWWITASCPADEWDKYGADCRNIILSFKRLK